MPVEIARADKPARDAFATDLADAQAHAWMLADPAFPAAARALARNFLDLGERDPVLASLFKDAGRYMTATSAILLHATGGVTLPRLKQVCAASGFLSAGRARMALQYLAHIGYVDRVPATGPGMPARYPLTGAFLAAWRAHLEAALSAAGVVEPWIATLCERMREPGVFGTLLRVQASRLASLAPQADQTPAVVRVFLHRHAGVQIVWTLLAAGGADIFPSPEPIPVALGAMARRFRVSHMHVRRLLGDAMREGLLRYDHHDRRGVVTFAQSGRMQLQWLYAAQLVELIASARETMAAVG